METPAEILAFFQNLVDDETYDPDFIYQLLTQAKNNVEDEFELEILKAVDTSKTNANGDNYLTMKALPADYRKVRNVSVGQMPYSEIPFERREQWKDSGYRFYIDNKNLQYAICGRGTGNVINFFYFILTDDLSSSNEGTSVPYWPKRFLPLIAYEAAYIIQSGVDADQISFRMSSTQLAMRETLRTQMRNWNADIALSAMNNQGGFAENVEGDWPMTPEGNIPNLGNM